MNQSAASSKRSMKKHKTIIGTALLTVITVATFGVINKCHLDIYGVAPVSSYSVYVDAPPYEGTQYRDWPDWAGPGRLAINATNWVRATLATPAVGETTIATVCSYDDKGRLGASASLTLSNGLRSGVWYVWRPYCTNAAFIAAPYVETSN
ncbi:hypothetical protein D4Q85_00185 [bacterium]|nr:MAG: hypothetical protein D4Q85_00185 [bacterium]